MYDIIWNWPLSANMHSLSEWHCVHCPISKSIWTKDMWHLVTTKFPSLKSKSNIALKLNYSTALLSGISNLKYLVISKCYFCTPFAQPSPCSWWICFAFYSIVMSQFNTDETVEYFSAKVWDVFYLWKILKLKQFSLLEKARLQMIVATPAAEVVTVVKIGERPQWWRCC